MRRPLPAIRLRLARIEKKPKSVFVKHWSDFAGVKRRVDIQEELLDIIESIEAGIGAPEACYRTGIDRTPEGLLERHGIMHLHLGGKESDILVFLIQYVDRVVLLETNSHIHFRTQPSNRGKTPGISIAERSCAVSSHAKMAEIRDAVTRCRRLLHLRARGFAPLTQPAGKNLLALSQSWLANLEHQIADAMNEARVATNDAARGAAEEKRSRLAASIAAFKAKAGIT